MNILKINLSLFGEGGEGGESTGESAPSESKGEQIKYESTRRTQKGELENVKYGKTADVSGNIESQVATDKNSDVKVTSNTLEDRKKAFQDLIQGEYKDLYTEATQGIINRRFKETKELESKLTKHQPLIDLLSERYGADGDIDKIMDGFNNDNDFWYSQAEEAGMSVEQYKEWSRLKRENAELLKQQEYANETRFAQEQTNRWTEEAQALKEKYPEFDLVKEVENPKFLNLLKAGTTMEHAFKVIHFDDIMAAEKKTTEKAVIETIRAKGTRPQENGVASQSSFIVKDNVSALTKYDRAEIAKRVARGDIITF